MIIELENIKNELGGYAEPVAELKRALDLDNKANRVEELEQMMQAPDFWDDPEKSQQLSKELKDKKVQFKQLALSEKRQYLTSRKEVGSSRINSLGL